MCLTEAQTYFATQGSSNFLLWMNSLQVSVRSHAGESYWEVLSFSTVKYAAPGDISSLIKKIISLTDLKTNIQTRINFQNITL